MSVYHDLQGTVSDTLGGAATQIRESVMSEEELYNARRSQISDLMSKLENVVDPGRIDSIASEIASPVRLSRFNLARRSERSNRQSNLPRSSMKRRTWPRIVSMLV
ncbi:MAG: hypothetical protein U5O39_00390 [Gammaproteobacteria bacterium]|nr:hypothetical protein [Gammaproteobacteria bacterium]